MTSTYLLVLSAVLRVNASRHPPSLPPPPLPISSAVSRGYRRRFLRRPAIVVADVARETMREKLSRAIFIRLPLRARAQDPRGAHSVIRKHGPIMSDNFRQLLFVRPRANEFHNILSHPLSSARFAPCRGFFHVYPDTRLPSGAERYNVRLSRMPTSAVYMRTHPIERATYEIAE